MRTRTKTRISCMAWKEIISLCLLTLVIAIGLSAIGFVSSYPYVVVEETTERPTPEKPLVFQASAKQTATVIFLHGLGGSANGAPTEILAHREPYIKYIFPQADKMHVKVRGGKRVNSWFAIDSFEFDAKIDVDGVNAASKIVHALIDVEWEKHQIPSDRVIVGGFSQGGALALASAFTYPKPLAGVIALSAWMPFTPNITQSTSPNRKVPIFQATGKKDDVFILLGRHAEAFISSLKSMHLLRLYPKIAHEVSEQEVLDVQAFIRNRLPKS